MTKFKYVYFDVGGVLVRDFSSTNKWEEMKKDLGVQPDKNRTFDEIWENHAKRACLDYDVDNLLPIIKEQIEIDIEENYSILEDIVSRFEINSGIWPLANEARAHCKVGLITNMFPGMLNLIFDKGLLPNIEWDDVIDSSKVMLQKPDHKIYEYAENKTKVKPYEILFIDNLDLNLAPARERGWQTFLYDLSDINKSNEMLHKYLDLK